MKPDQLPKLPRGYRWKITRDFRGFPMVLLKKRYCGILWLSIDLCMAETPAGKHPWEVEEFDKAIQCTAQNMARALDRKRRVDSYWKAR